MAKVITTELQHSGASGANITLDSSKNVTCENNLTVDGTTTLTGAVTLPAGTTSDTLSHRNIIINGEMQIAQRSTSVTGANTGYNTADRWKIIRDTGTLNQTVENDGPPGFARSLKHLFSDANSPSAGNGRTVLRYSYEGFDVQKVGYGTSGCKKLTLSFWVKSNVTGTYVVRFYRRSADRLASASYTISSSATWEKKSVTFPVDTTGVTANNNTRESDIEWALVAGATESTGTLATAWDSWNNNDQSSLTGQVNVAAAANNYWQITGVQLETGDSATEFEHRSYGDELARCQRYYYMHVTHTAADSDDKHSLGQGSYYTSTEIVSNVSFPTPMRARPTLESTNSSTGGGAFVAYRDGTSDFFNLFYGNKMEITHGEIHNSQSAQISGTAGQGCLLRLNQDAGDGTKLAFTAEL